MRPHSAPLLLVLFTVAIIGNAYVSALWSLPTEYLSKSAAAAAVGMINALGSIPGFFGPYLLGYLSTKTGSFSPGLAVLLCTALAGGLLVLCVPKRKGAPLSRVQAITQQTTTQVGNHR